MERRQFLTGTVAASACALAGLGAGRRRGRADPTYIHDVFATGATTVGCCTDGFRPVFFKIERVDA
jgi:uncharacterized repeat protein (TIGR04076 family)